MRVALLISAAMLLTACVQERCYAHADCDAPKICGANGLCSYECAIDSDCAIGFTCEDHQCLPTSSETLMICPEDMVKIAEVFCIDIYEASRSDADPFSAGYDDSRATSVFGVMPWRVENNERARAACEAAGKRLCDPLEWQLACEGPDNTVYAYGDSYEPQTCNGIDTFGRNDFHLMPTGSFSSCTNEWGVFDINGNLWEHTAHGSDSTVRGGAYNCSDSAMLHRCDYVPGSWEPSARGFRCCLTPTSSVADTETETNSITGSETNDFSSEENSESTEDGTESGGCVDDTANTDADADADTDTDSEMNTDTEANQDTISDAEPYDTNVSLCPEEMVAVDSFCIDRYEASREDATDTSVGTASIASSRPGVLPWMPVTSAIARSACEAEGKRLCRQDEWFSSCAGSGPSVYSYGDFYNPVICNSIDTYCYCDGDACRDLTECPYPHCYNQASATEEGGPCGASFHVMPTGSFPECTNEWGVFDINGNVWEIVDFEDGLEHFRGGAYNCLDSELLHQCDYDATWSPSAKGFRCCKDRVNP